ncbi:hypothetical protein JVU11DRAFT_537 [Chiua virens]|nr:hypothetical protein JVU11DRAFT_537 [Chiua virens]
MERGRHTSGVSRSQIHRARARPVRCADVETPTSAAPKGGWARQVWLKGEVMERWLRETAGSYLDRERVCLDVEATLTRFPTLRPKSDVYTYDDGRAQLLLCLHGLLPISFRGSTYNIPIAIWITKSYPRQPPLAYVVPTTNMLVRPSRHIDLSGRCTIQYLLDWERKPEPCNLVALLQAMQDHFSRLPPLYAKPRSSSPRPAPQPLPSPSNPLSHPLSHNEQPLSLSQSRSLDPDRPPLPPKPISNSAPPHPTPPPPSPLGYPPPNLYNRPPPPLPQQPRAESRLPQYHQSILPPQSVHSPDGNISRSAIEQSRDSSSPISPNYRASTPPVPFSDSYSPPPHVHPPVLPPPLSQSTHQPQPQPHLLASPAVSIIPRPNLLDDESSYPLPPPAAAPPRPPNPELLQLHAHVHDKMRSEFSSLSQLILLETDRLRTQQSDLLAGEPAIRDEMARLEAVRDVCRNVASRLRSSVEQAERNLSELRRKGDPEVDELVCSTSIVHNQLINLVAEDNGIEDTIYHLHRALNTGRIDLERFLRTTRVLAEEQFMKRALIEKIQAGIPMGTTLPYS